MTERILLQKCDRGKEKKRMKERMVKKLFAKKAEDAIVDTAHIEHGTANLTQKERDQVSRFTGGRVVFEKENER